MINLNAWNVEIILVYVLEDVKEQLGQQDHKGLKD